MKILIRTLAVVAGLVIILSIWLSLMDKKFAEADPDNYIRTSEELFAQAGIQPQSKYLETDGPVKKVHYYEMGSGRPLILIHGGGGHAVQWYTVMKALADSFHLYVLDRPGCGLTDYFDYSGVDLPVHGADFVRSFMDAAGIERASLVGHSMGGLFSISFAHDQPHRVEKLMLIGHPAGGTQEIPPMMRLMGVKGINKLMLRMIGTPNVEGAKAFHALMLVGDTSKLSDLYLQNDVYAQMIPGTGASFSSLLENCVGLGGFKESYLMESKLQALSLPVYFFIGEKDVWDTVENAESIVATLKNAEIEIIKGAGHLPWLDDPVLCARLIQQAMSDSMSLS